MAFWNNFKRLKSVNKKKNKEKHMRNIPTEHSLFLRRAYAAIAQWQEADMFMFILQIAINNVVLWPYICVLYTCMAAHNIIMFYPRVFAGNGVQHTIQ